MESKTTKKVTRGRPVCEIKQAEQKAKLIFSAKQLLNIKSYSQITIRDIASEASINSAMIKYYFGGKENLFVELIQSIADEQFSQFEDLGEHKKPVYLFIRRFGEILQSHPGIVHLLSEEVLNKTTPLARAFMAAFPARVSKFLPPLIQQETGISDTKKAKLAAFQLITLLVSPYILKTLRQQAWQIDDTEIQGEAWAKDLYRHFIYGLKESNINEVES
ncbi:TetR/AcrR family transcriptional regulator [Pseudoalteromonas luteoviolacea]|uniref:TetR/AcrR family transcriptional regulator n=1 Tax=Pseudoalteromonas luteoviolacea TaxID=43657 RepID=UPI001B35E723|nr:TetR/AcrR family transcriptional regulator [Pseudoalteromonas luteoviolacea]MBQ4836931.1 TetR/AcrR family transcriptional regulator [Pseudoalteromonas luteoviolacea]